MPTGSSAVPQQPRPQNSPGFPRKSYDSSTTDWSDSQFQPTPPQPMGTPKTAQKLVPGRMSKPAMTSGTSISRPNSQNSHRNVHHSRPDLISSTAV